MEYVQLCVCDGNGKRRVAAIHPSKESSSQVKAAASTTTTTAKLTVYESVCV